MKHALDSKSLYWASFNRFSLRLSGEAVEDIAQQGDASEAVAYWVNQVEYGSDIFGRLQATPEAIRAELKECGAWDAEELSDDEQNRHRIVWCAACNVAEEDEPDCSDPLVQSGEVGPFRNYAI